MSNPQQPELARSRKTPALDPDATASVVEGQRQPGSSEPGGPVPAENQPGHHPPKEQDKPDLDAFAQKLGVVEASDGEAASDGQASSDERDAGPLQAADRTTRIGLASAVATVMALLLAVLVGRRRRSRRSR